MAKVHPSSLPQPPRPPLPPCPPGLSQSASQTKITDQTPQAGFAAGTSTSLQYLAAGPFLADIHLSGNPIHHPHAPALPHTTPTMYTETAFVGPGRVYLVSGPIIPPPWFDKKGITPVVHQSSSTGSPLRLKKPRGGCRDVGWLYLST
jgi:hypothetical protein